MIALLILLGFFSLLLIVLLGFAGYYLWRFARIIWVLEAGFSQAVEVLQSTEATLGEVTNMQMYFDAPEVQEAVAESMAGVKASKIAVAGLVGKFTEWSKQKYIEEVVEEKA